MRTYRGIVCEKHDKHMIFLTQNGVFHKGIPLNANAEIGEEIEFYLATASLYNKKKQTVYYKLAPAILAALLFIFIGTSLLLQDKNAAAAYIQLNGEHTVEIGVNDKGEVVSIETRSNELDVENIEGLPIENALNKVMNEIYTKDEKLSISTKYPNENFPELKKQVEKAVKELQQNKSETNSNFKDNQSDENLKLENSKSADFTEEIEQTPNNQNQKQNDVEYLPDTSSPETNNNNNNKNNNNDNDKVKQENPNQSHNQEQEKVNQSNEKAKNEKQNIQKEQSSEKGNSNPTKNPVSKDNNTKSQNNNEN